MDDPQSFLRTTILTAIEPHLAWASFPRYKDRAIWVGDRRGSEVMSHGITCLIDGLSQYQAGRYSHLQRRNLTATGFVLDLYLPQDFNKRDYDLNLLRLTDAGKAIPGEIESMDVVLPLLLDALQDTREIESVRMLPPMQRGVYGDRPTLERVRVNVNFAAETCLV